MTRFIFPRWLILLSLGVCFFVAQAIAEDEIFRPKAGQFPPLEKSHAFRGELTFVDSPNRRGSLRIQGEGTYFRNPPHPFAMLPYGMIRYHGAPAELRDVPIGTVLHARGFLPPDPKLSSVPVLPINNRNKTAGYSGKGIAPAENHLILLEDEPSYCQRTGKIWKLQELEIQNHTGKITARREAKIAGKQGEVEILTFDAATRIWRGREKLEVADLIADGIWPANGKKALNDQVVLLGITWKPTPSNIFTRFHISDIWLNDTAMQRATRNQTETHKAFIRSRWMPGWINAVEYGKFGTATITATLFGGMDESLYADFQKNTSALMNAVESNLKHTHGAYSPAHMASKGPILDVVKTKGEIPFGSSGIQIQFKTDLIIEGIRPGRNIRVRPGHWPNVNIPREEYLGGNTPEERFPTPAIFQKY